MTIKAMAAGRFLVLPHFRVDESFARKAADYDAWLAGTNRRLRRMQGDGIGVTSQKGTNTSRSVKASTLSSWAQEARGASLTGWSWPTPGLTVEIDHPTFGSLWRAAPPIAFSETPGRVGLPCRRGEHNHAILTELGYGPAEVQAFEKESVVIAASP